MEGGANPLIGSETGADGGAYPLGTWSFTRNSLPLRVVATGKCHFAPVNLSSCFEAETKKMPLEPLKIKGCDIVKANYRWYRCSFIPSENHSAYYCYVPADRRTYYISEKYHSRHVKEMEKAREDPVGKSTYLACEPRCSLTLQIPENAVSATVREDMPEP